MWIYTGLKLSRKDFLFQLAEFAGKRKERPAKQIIINRYLILHKNARPAKLDIVKETDNNFVQVITPVQSVKRLLAESVQAKLSICVKDVRNKCKILK